MPIISQAPERGTRGRAWWVSVLVVVFVLLVGMAVSGWVRPIYLAAAGYELTFGRSEIVPWETTYLAFDGRRLTQGHTHMIDGGMIFYHLSGDHYIIAWKLPSP